MSSAIIDKKMSLIRVDFYFVQWVYGQLIGGVKSILTFMHMSFYQFKFPAICRDFEVLEQNLFIPML